MVAGKVHVGELSSEAAVRELDEKARISSLDIESIEFRGSAEVIITSNSEVVSHFIAQIYSTRLSSSPSEYSASEPVYKDDLDNREDLAPDQLQLLSCLGTSDAIFSEQLRLDAN